MKWACVFITDIKSVQIGEICVRIYDEDCRFVKKYAELHSNSNCKMSETAYSDVRRQISSKLNQILDGVEKIVVWDRTAFNLFNDVMSNKNNATRYVVVMKDSRYFPYKSETLNSVFTKMELKLDESANLNAPLCEIMCEIISCIAIKIYQTSPYFINSISEYRSIIKSKTANVSNSVICVQTQKVEPKLEKVQLPAKEKSVVNSAKKTPDKQPTVEMLIEARAQKVRECCEKYGLTYRIDFDTVFINTWLSSWFFSLCGGKIRIRHENSRNKHCRQKFYERYHDQKKEFVFEDIEEAIQYINNHDIGQKKHYK